MKFAFIRESLNEYPVEICCEVLEISRSGFYAWSHRPISSQKKRRESLGVKIKKVHEENRCVYGSPRICQALRAQGEKINEKTVVKVMKELEIKAETKKPFIPSTTDSGHANPVARNILNREFAAERPNRKWVVDITYIPTDQGWLYLAGVMDLCSRRIVGWSMAPHMKSELVHHENYATFEQARASIFEYIEVFYNRKRLHSSIGYNSPEAFEAGLN